MGRACTHEWQAAPLANQRLITSPATCTAVPLGHNNHGCWSQCTGTKHVSYRTSHKRHNHIMYYSMQHRDHQTSPDPDPDPDQLPTQDATPASAPPSPLTHHDTTTCRISHQMLGRRTTSESTQLRSTPATMHITKHVVLGFEITCRAHPGANTRPPGHPLVHHTHCCRAGSLSTHSDRSNSSTEAHSNCHAGSSQRGLMYSTAGRSAELWQAQ
jgi:hypothetical protein